MRGLKKLCIGVAVCFSAAAQVAPTTVRVSSEVAPPGGIAQVKVLLTSPKPITSGGMFADLSAVSFDSIDGISLFSSTGDVEAAAIVSAGKVNVTFTSPNGTFGTDLDYPILTIAVRLSSTAIPGQVFPVAFNGNFLQGLVGTPIEVQPGSITVGGSVSITNVIPGSGFMPIGSTFHILGMGFGTGTKVQLGCFKSQIQYVSPTDLLVTAKDAGVLDGCKILAQNPDKSTDTYYSYMRGVPQGASIRPLLARTVPVFSINTMFEAAIPSTISPLVNPAYFTAIAVQNPSEASTNVVIETRSSAGAVTGSRTVSLPPHGWISREVSELFGAVLPTGSYLRVLASSPVQVVGLLGNDTTGAVLPIAPVVISAPAAIVVTPTPTGGGGGGTAGGTGGRGTGGGKPVV